MRFRFVIGTLGALGLFPSLALAAECGGRLVRVADGRTVSFDTMISAISKTPLIAVGERHGLKEHVGAAACLLKNLNNAAGSSGKRALVVEHVAFEKQPLIDAYRKDHPTDANGLGEVLNWAKSGWPAWSIYEPLYAAAFSGGNAVYGADQPKGTPTPTLEELAPRLGANAARVISTWGGLMNEAHCKALTEAQAEKFGRAQANRDLAMASIVQAVPTRQVLFYSGREHGRMDVSVPYLVRTGGKLPATPIAVSIALQETSIGKERVKPSEALARARGRHDYVWFIGKAPEEDVCAVFRNKGQTPVMGK